jgi:hypothetical protein
MMTIIMEMDVEEEEEVEEEAAAHDPMPTDGASTRAHILLVGDSNRTQPYWRHISEADSNDETLTSHTTVCNRQQYTMRIVMKAHSSTVI